MENSKEKKQIKQLKILVIILLAIIAILAGQLIYIKTNIKTIIVEKEKYISQNLELKAELDELMAEHERIKKEYESVSSQLAKQDSIIMAQAKEIEKLIQSQADYRRIKRQLNYLRSITQGYINQIDSLYRINQQLVAENIEIKENLKTERKKFQELEKDKQSLEEKISSAAYLKAYNITATPLSIRKSGKEEESSKARKVNAIKVCFTISENQLVPAGTKDIFMRIARPDNYILTQGSYSFIYKGNRIQYTEKTSINYDKKAQNVCITYQNNDIEFMKGVYNVTLFADDNEIGQGHFELK